MRRMAALVGAFVVLMGAGAPEPSLTIQTPTEVKVASAVAASSKAEISGKVQDHAVVFSQLAADTSYDVKLALADGSVIQGVDLSWYDAEPARADAGDLSDDDRSAISDIVHVPSFYNKSDVLALRGDHSRAVALVQLVRDRDFYNGKGEVVWRVELWYFQEEFGGWEKVAQQNKIVRRERFKTREAYDATIAKLKWAPELGGIRVSADDSQMTVKLEEHK